MVEPPGALRVRYVPITVTLHGAEQSGFAYLPDALPPTVELESATWTALVDAGRSLGELSGSVKAMPSALLSVRPTIRREAVSTSALEGTYAVIEDVLEAEVADHEPRGEVREVVNYVRAVEQGIARLAAGHPITLNLIHELHAILMQGVRYERGQPGRTRTSQVLVGARYGSLADAAHVPPPPGDELVAGLHAWESWIHDETIHALIRAGLGHYQFEVLHPYTDGNGRIGRLIVVLQLIEAGLLPGHVLAISPHLDSRREEYLGELAKVTATGDVDSWLRFFASALTASAEDALRRVRALRATVDEIRRSARDDGLRGTVIQIIDQLIEYPMVTVSQVSERREVTFQAANTAVAKLVDRGVLVEITGQSQNRRFLAPAILRLLQQT